MCTQESIRQRRHYLLVLQFNFYYCAYGGCGSTHATELTSEGNLVKLLLTFHLTWVPGVELRLSDSDSKHLYWLSHITGPRLSLYSCDSKGGYWKSDSFHPRSRMLGLDFDPWGQFFLWVSGLPFGYSCPIFFYWTVCNSGLTAKAA